VKKLPKQVFDKSSAFRRSCLQLRLERARAQPCNTVVTQFLLSRPKQIHRGIREEKRDFSSRPQPTSEIIKWRERRNRGYSTTGQVQSAQKPDQKVSKLARNPVYLSRRQKLKFAQVWKKITLSRHVKISPGSKIAKKLPKRAQPSPKSVKIGQKSSLFESPSKTEIRSSFDENHLVKACQNLARLKNCQKMHKRAQPSPKSVKIGQKSGFFSSPSKLKFDEF